MIYIGPISSIFDYATFGLMWFIYHCSTKSADGYPGEKLFQTAWFVESLLTQTLIVHIIRTNRIPFIQSSPSWQLFLGTMIVMAVGAWLPYSPMAHFLGFCAVRGAPSWAWMGLFLLSYIDALCHHAKMWFLRKFGTD